MTDTPDEDPGANPFDEELHDVRRSYVGLAFAAILVIALVWIVNAIKESNRIVACEASGHHDCVPLDTSVRGPSR
ncbi:MAG: hypothetical protein ACREN6_00605 [Gemmatimonadaceae bacterium]